MFALSKWDSKVSFPLSTCTSGWMHSLGSSSTPRVEEVDFSTSVEGDAEDSESFSKLGKESTPADPCIFPLSLGDSLLGGVGGLTTLGLSSLENILVSFGSPGLSILRTLEEEETGVEGESSSCFPMY